MTANTVLWIYIVLLVVGGFIGFIKAKSKASIIASVAFAIPLALCAAGIIDSASKVGAIVPDILIGLLIVVFVMRLAKTKKFMPSGMMLIVSALALVAHLVVK